MRPYLHMVALCALFLLFSTTTFAQTYTTIADGNWTSASTWQGGSIPPTSNTIPTAATINIRHTVNYNTGNPIKLDGLLHIEPVSGTTARLNIPTGINIEIFSPGRLRVYNGSFVQYRFVPGNDGQPYSGNNPGATKLSGTLKNIGGTVDALNAYFEIAQDFVNESGGRRTMKNTCVKTGQNFSMSGSTSIDTLHGTNVSIGWHGSGSYQVSDGTATYQALRVQLAGTSGSFSLNSGTVNGDIDYVMLRNNIVPFNGSGQIFASSSVSTSGINLDAYCVSTPSNYIHNNKFTGTRTATCSLNYFPGDCSAGGAAPSAFVDLFLAKSVDNSGCFSSGVPRTFTLTATNLDDNFLGTGVTVENTLPSGITFVSSTGDGSYDPLSGIWTVGDILPGQVKTRNINVTMNGTSPVTNSAAFGPLNQPDPVADNNLASVTLFACAPTSAPASITGRVTSPDGRGLAGVIVQVSGGQLDQPIMITTGTFGNFAFKSLPSGQTYFITVHSKRHVFADPVRSVFLHDDLFDVNFISNM